MKNLLSFLKGKSDSTIATLPIEGALPLIEHYGESDKEISVPLVAIYNTKQLAAEIAQALKDSAGDNGQRGEDS